VSVDESQRETKIASEERPGDKANNQDGHRLSPSPHPCGIQKVLRSGVDYIIGPYSAASSAPFVIFSARDTREKSNAQKIPKVEKPRYADLQPGGSNFLIGGRSDLKLTKYFLITPNWLFIIAELADTEYGYALRYPRALFPREKVLLVDLKSRFSTPNFHSKSQVRSSKVFCATKFALKKSK
jgi:hypothetical protein